MYAELREVKNKAREFLAGTGLTVAEFETLLPEFEVPNFLYRPTEGTSGRRNLPLALVEFWQGGKSYYGGLMGGGIAGGLFFYYRKLPVLGYADASMPALALGYAIGRLGCLVNGDDYGTLTHVPWAVVYPAGTEAHAAHVAHGWINPGATWSLPVHPVQLYASLLGLSLFVCLASWRPMRPGSRFCAFVTSYGTARFVMEWLRGDFHTVLGPFSVPQLFSLFFVLTGLGVGLVLVSGTHVVVRCPVPEAPGRSAPV